MSSSQKRRELRRVSYVSLGKRFAGGVGNAGASAQVPVQQKQGGKALLPIERNELAVFDVSVYEVEMHRTTAGKRAMENIEKRIPNPGRLRVATALRVIALDDGHLNAFNPVTSKEVAE